MQSDLIWVMLPVVVAAEYDDDSLRRFVIRRYAFDPVRRQRRHIVIAVVDNNRDFKRLLRQLNDELQSRRASGEGVDVHEHVTGHVMEPGHLARAANGHLLRRAVEHGVMPEQLRSLELPSNIAVFPAAHRQ